MNLELTHDQIKTIERVLLNAKHALRDSTASPRRPKDLKQLQRYTELIALMESATDCGVINLTRA